MISHKHYLNLILIPAIVVWIWVGVATAQEPKVDEPPAKPAKPKAQQRDMLLEFAQKAVLNNPEVQMHWHNLEAAVNEKDSAKGGFMPRLDITADAGRERGASLFTPYYDVNTRDNSVTLTQMLYDGFATRNEVRRLSNAQLARYYELLDASETAALEAVKAFYDLSKQRELFELTEENYVRHRTAFEQIKLKVEAGVGRRVDLEQASGRLALSESNLILDNANVHDASARFQRVVGETPPEKIRKSPSQIKLEKQIIPNAADATLATGLDYHPAILAAIENVRSAHYDAYERYGKYQPTVNLVVSKTDAENSGGIVGNTGATSAKIVMNWNLFDGGADHSRASQYISRYEAAKDQRDKTCRDVRMNLEIAYNDIYKLTEQLKFLDQHQLSIEKAQVAYQKQFDIGQRNLLDLLDTENELYQAKRSYVNAEYDLYIAQARTLAGMGKLVSTLGISRLETADLPELLGNGVDGAEHCPPDPSASNTIDKEKLDARAIEEARAAIEEARRKAIENTGTEKSKLDSEDTSFLNTPAEAAAKAKAEAKKKELEQRAIDDAREKQLRIKEAAKAAEALVKARQETAAAQAEKQAAILAKQAAEIETAQLRIKLAETEEARKKAQADADETWDHRTRRFFSKVLSPVLTSSPSGASAVSTLAQPAHTAAAVSLAPAPINAASYSVQATGSVPMTQAVGGTNSKATGKNSQDFATLLQQRVRATQEMLAHADKKGFSIQLFATDDVRPAHMEGFLSRAKNLGALPEIYLAPAKINGKDGLKVLYGIYANSETARIGMEKLPQRYKDSFAPLIKSLNNF